MKKYFLLALTVICTGLVPVVALSDVGDVFNCNQSGVTAVSAGSTRPLGGPYVPTADYAVELNTGLMVYKECVLREIVTAKRKAAAAQLDQQILQTFSGYPSKELGHEEVQLADKTVIRYLTPDPSSDKSPFQNFNATLRTAVQQSVSRAYINTRDPRLSFKCGYTGDLGQVLQGSPSGSFWDAFDAVTNNPACSPFSADMLGYDAIMSQTQYELYKNKERVDWGEGVYPVVHLDDNGFIVTDTPGQIVLQNGIMAEQSGYKQLEQADDIGELVDGLYAGVSNQVLAPSSNPGTPSNGTTPGTGGTPGGLAGIAQYMAQVVQSAVGTYTQTTGSSVVAVIQQALSTEQQYVSIVNATANLLTQTIAALRGKETTCYTLITNSVCQGGTIASSSCTSLSGGTLDTTIRPNPGFAQSVINNSIAPQVSPLQSAVSAGSQKVVALQSLLASVAANPSQAAQQAALTALSGINPDTDTSGATQRQTTLTQAMATLLSQTSDAWTQPGAWCDAGTQSVKDAWTACWSGTSSSCPHP